MAGERDMKVKVRGTLKPYCTPFWFPRLVIPATEWATSLSQEVVGLGGSETLGSFLFGCLEFFGLEIYLDWRKAVSRLAAPIGHVFGHH